MMLEKIVARAHEIRDRNDADVAKALEFERKLNGDTPVTSPRYIALVNKIQLTWHEASLLAILDIKREQSEQTGWRGG